MKYFLIYGRDNLKNEKKYWTTTEQFGYVYIPDTMQVIQFWVYEK